MKRIGLFGGTFNPIHKGHLRAATSVREGFGLDTVILIPAAIPPHKHSKVIAPAGDRLEMARLVAADLENTVVSDVELVRSGPSYTIDTVYHFQRKFNAGTELFFIVGVDAFLEIDTWKSFDDLFLSVPMIVLDRPGEHGNGSSFQTIQKFLVDRISKDYLPNEDGSSFSHPLLQTVFLHGEEMIDVSSTRIRQRIGMGEGVSDMLPRLVEDYIRRKGLYK